LSGREQTTLRKRRPEGRVTIIEVAREAGVSQGTASAVLSNGSGNIRVAPPTRQRVQQIAHRLGYRPNATARTLVQA